VIGLVDLRPALPALIVAFAGLVVLLAQAFTPKGQPSPSIPLALTGLLGALAALWLMASGLGRGAVLGGSLTADAYALFFQGLVVAITILAVLLSSSYLRATGLERGEHFTLMLFSLVGMMGLVSCVELVSLFVALEIMSVALYGLAGLRRDRPESQESALKYFLTGAFSSAFFLYGVALLYGVSGSTTLERITAAVKALPEGEHGLALLGIGFLLVGFGFKVASVPFHMWAPDVYEGAPTNITAFMAAGVKAAAFGAFLRIFGQSLAPLGEAWKPAVAVLAVVTMVVGNLGALAQTNVKRMLAYSSVAHAGYLLTGMVARWEIAASAVAFYLAGYGATVLGAFGAMAALARGGREPLSLSDLTGLAHRRPALAAAMTVFLVSLAGVPISAGFLGKFYLFGAAVSGGYVSLAIVGVIMSVASAYFYLRVVVYMYMRDPLGEDPWGVVSPVTAAALAAAVLLVLGLGVWPGPVLGWARAAAQSLL
jgi:NADH-quinone oxidoreductase subunit N